MPSFTFLFQHRLPRNRFSTLCMTPFGSFLSTLFSAPVSGLLCFCFCISAWWFLRICWSPLEKNKLKKKQGLVQFRIENCALSYLKFQWKISIPQPENCKIGKTGKRCKPLWNYYGSSPSFLSLVGLLDLQLTTVPASSTCCSLALARVNNILFYWEFLLQEAWHFSCRMRKNNRFFAI